MMAQQKRSAAEADNLLGGVKALLLDIEGTTTPVSFVKETLFPHVTDNLEKFLTNHYDDTETQKDIAALRCLAAKDKEESVSGVVDIPDGEANKEDIIKAVVSNVKWQMGCDRKSTELKQLQGHVWQEGYALGEIKGELYEDVVPVLQQLTDEGLKIFVFSSGSVESQRLLFQHTAEDEDCQCLFSGYYDTTTGSKTSADSYKKIKEEIGFEADEILFLTDTPDEARAAVEAGMRSTLVMREDGTQLSSQELQDFSCITNFNELFGEDDYDDEDVKRLEGEEDDDEEDEPDEDDDDDLDENQEQEEEDDCT